jgi:hypothetical protein
VQIKSPQRHRLTLPHKVTSPILIISRNLLYIHRLETVLLPSQGNALQITPPIAQLYPTSIRERAPCEEQTNFSARDTPITPSHNCTSHLAPYPLREITPPSIYALCSKSWKIWSPISCGS